MQTFAVVVAGGVAAHNLSWNSAVAIFAKLVGIGAVYLVDETTHAIVRWSNRK